MLGWLTRRGLRLSAVGQADLDTWHAERRDRAVRTFLRWAMSSGDLQPLWLPAKGTTERPPISQHRRLAWTRRALTDESVELLGRRGGPGSGVARRRG